MRIDWDVNTSYSLGRDEGKSFKHRTTLRTRHEEEQIVWKDMEFYECAEEWREEHNGYSARDREVSGHHDHG